MSALTLDTRARKRAFPRLSFLRASGLAMLGLALASWLFIVLADGADVVGLFSLSTFQDAFDFIKDLLGIGASGTPALLDGGRWRHALDLAADTVAMSVLAAGIAAIGVTLTVMAGARNIAFGELTPAPRLWRVTFFFTRGLYLLTRSIPELIWAMMVIFVLSPGILAGALALALHNLGVMGKLGSEVIEDMDPRPARALRSAGASNAQLFLYAVLPQVLPQLLTYLLYRWEVIIRTTIVVGFVAAGGLGYDFRLNMSFFRYDEIGLLLAVYVLLVWGVDLVSTGLRRLAR